MFNQHGMNLQSGGMFPGKKRYLPNTAGTSEGRSSKLNRESKTAMNSNSKGTMFTPTWKGNRNDSQFRNTLVSFEN